jgi:hypothetical protein
LATFGLRKLKEVDFGGQVSERLKKICWKFGLNKHGQGLLKAYASSFLVEIWWPKTEEEIYFWGFKEAKSQKQWMGKWPLKQTAAALSQPKMGQNSIG